MRTLIFPSRVSGLGLMNAPANLGEVAVMLAPAVAER
jgi:hypothetical protein